MPETAFVKVASRSAVVSLSASQAKVAQLPLDAKAVVFGSPGSGKTTALKALYLAKVAKDNPARVETHEVLAIAASREAANLLRDELALAFQGATSGPMARSLSSFAFQVLRQQALALGTKAPELISGAEQDLILKQILETAGELKLDWPRQINAQVISLRGFRAELRDLITVCLEYRLTPEALRTLAHSANKPEWVAVSALYANYLERLREPAFENRHDASTLLAVAAELLESGEGFTKEVAAVKLVLIDDAQELTPGARRFIRALVSRGAGLVLFGDPDTATLGFRAADARSMTTLMQEVGAKPEQFVLLSEHQPRTPGIARVLGNLSSELPSEQGGLQRRDYVSARELIETDESLERHVFNTSQAETSWMARRLRELYLDEKIEWSEIAIVARSRAILENLEASLAAESVPVSIRLSRSALRDEFASRALLDLAELAVGQEDLTIEDAKRLLASPFCGIDSLMLRRLRRSLRRAEIEAGGDRTTDELLLELFVAPGTAATVNTIEARVVSRFALKFAEARKLVAEKANVEHLFWHFWQGSAPQGQWPEQSIALDDVGSQLGRNLDAIVALFGAANRFVERYPEAEASTFINQQLQTDLPEDTLTFNDRDDSRVSLLTPAGLIAKRFKVVFVAGLQDGVWPNLKPRSSLLGATALAQFASGRTETVEAVAKNELPDELRMLHKAVGAASERLVVTAVESEDAQVSTFMRSMFGVIPDPEDFVKPQYTLRGMVGSLRRRLTESNDSVERMACALGLARLAVEQTPGANPANWYGLLPISTEEPLTDLDETDAEVYIKPSQLEAFISCPLHWFMNEHGATDSSFEASLGTLIHSVAEHEEGKSETELLELLEQKWSVLEFEADWLEAREKRRAKRMIGNLVRYIQQVSESGGEVLAREAKFNFKIGSARVSGKVDRIERLADGSIMIVDLKTGIEVSKDKAQEHPQLGLYQLAFANHAFDHIDGIDASSVLGGAKLVFVNDKNMSERPQDSLGKNDEKREHFENMVASVVEEMAMGNRVFVANVGSHCSDERSYGNCKLHLAKAVTYFE
jgi:superfamily I DNA/RNA helicase/RecB family exonuclease